MGARVWRRADSAPSATQGTGASCSENAPAPTCARGPHHSSKELHPASRTCQSNLAEQQKQAPQHLDNHGGHTAPTGHHSQQSYKPVMKHKTEHVPVQQRTQASIQQAHNKDTTSYSATPHQGQAVGNRFQQNPRNSYSQQHSVQSTTHHASTAHPRHHRQSVQNTAQVEHAADDTTTHLPRAKRPRIDPDAQAGGQHPQHSQPRPKPAPPQKVDLAAELSSKMAAMEELKRQLQEKEAELARQKELQAAQEAARIQQLQQQQQQQEEAMKRKVQLARGFKSLASNIGQTSNTGEGSRAAGTAAASQAKAPAAPAADEWEVARVLHSKNDYECLQLHVGASLAQVRRSYKSMAMSLHPDKCKIAGAAEAFQRLKKAYDHLCAVTS